MRLWIVSNFVLQVTSGYQELIALSKTISAVLILSIYDHFNLELLLTHLRSLPSDLTVIRAECVSLSSCCLSRLTWFQITSEAAAGESLQTVTTAALHQHYKSIWRKNLMYPHIYLCCIFHKRQPWTCCVDLEISCDTIKTSSTFTKNDWFPSAELTCEGPTLFVIWA